MILIEKNTDVKIKCYSCGNEYTMDMMRMHPDGKHLACRSCIDRKPMHKQEAKSSIGPARQEEPATKEYFCKDCRYSFKRAKHLHISTCPYCGSGSLMQKGSTARIIADASKMKGDFEFR